MLFQLINYNEHFIHPLETFRNEICKWKLRYKINNDSHLIRWCFFSSISFSSIATFPQKCCKHCNFELSRNRIEMRIQPTIVSLASLIGLLHCRQRKHVISSPSSYHSSWTGVSCRCNVPCNDKTLLHEQFCPDELNNLQAD